MELSGLKLNSAEKKTTCKYFRSECKITDGCALIHTSTYFFSTLHCSLYVVKGQREVYCHNR